MNYLPERFRTADERIAAMAKRDAALKVSDTMVRFGLPEEYDPSTIVCERQSCPCCGIEQEVVGAWDQPAHFVDPSRIYLLACGCEAM